MANTLLFNPFIQVVNANGKPYAGAKLYTYQAGTTTPLASYANSNLTTPHTNPVIADANGTFPAIYLQKQSYKLRLETSAGVLIDETDNVDSTESAVEQYVNSLLQTTLTEIIGDLYAGKDYRLTNGGTVYNQLFSVKSDVTSSDIGLNTTSNNLDINFSYVNTSSQNIRNAYISAVSTSKTAGSESANLIVGSRSGYVSVETGGAERLRVESTSISTTNAVSVQNSTGGAKIDLFNTAGTNVIINQAFNDLSFLSTSSNTAWKSSVRGYVGGFSDQVGLSFFTTAAGVYSEQMRLSSDGKLTVNGIGIGTASPATTLDVNGDVTITDKIIHSGDTDTAIRFPAVDTVTVETGGAERLRVTPAGNVGIGGTATSKFVAFVTPSASADDGLSVQDASSRSININRTGGSYSYQGITGAVGLVYSSNTLALMSDTTNPILFSAGGFERMRIASSGAIHFPSVGTTASAANAFLDSGATPANQLLRSTSSIQYKTEVTDLTEADAYKAFDLRPITYKSLAKADDQTKTHFGLIAEEVAEIEPRLVHYVNGQPDGVQYERLCVLLLKVVKDLKGEVDALKAQVQGG